MSGPRWYPVLLEARLEGNIQPALETDPTLKGSMKHWRLLLNISKSSRYENKGLEDGSSCFVDVSGYSIRV